MKNSRKRKIGYQLRKRVGNPYLELIPALTLSGNWFHEVGFTLGSQVVVLVEPGKITITV